MALPAPTLAFELANPDAAGPLILSVPHGGHVYSSELLAKLRPPAERIVALEDRRVDALALRLADVPTLIAHAPRVWIDLNRHEAEIDSGLVEGAMASQSILTPKVRSGLGLIPRRLTGVGELWRGRLTLADVEARIASVHRPYHAALTQLLGRATRRHGVAVLLDLHSMPPLQPQSGLAPARIVIGTRYGQSAAPWVTACIGGACQRHGLSWRENSPYAGGHIVERHGCPQQGAHAVQLEIDRSLYLGSGLTDIDPQGLAATRRFVADVIGALTAAALDTMLPLAAE